MNMKNPLALILSTVCITLTIGAGCAGDDGTRVLFVVSNNGDLGDTGEKTGVWMAEVTHPHAAVADSGLDVRIDLASPDGGDAPIDAFSVRFHFDDFLATGDPTTGDPDNDRFMNDLATRDLVAVETVDVTRPDGTVESLTSHRFVDTLALSEIDVGEYDAIYFAGGNGAMWQFPGNGDIAAVVNQFHEDGKIVSAACHGTAALLDVQSAGGEYLVDGRRVTGFSTAEEVQLGQDQIMPLLLQDEFPRRNAIYVEADPWQPNVVIDGRIITGQNPPSAAGVGLALAEALGAD